MNRLRVSANRRFLQQADGSPFFYLGDTAWELFHRLTFEEADHYLQDRAAKGFNVIQAVALAELDGLHTPNAHGHCPLENDDPTRPVEAYWAHVDRVVACANDLGMLIGFLPTWGDKWHAAFGTGPVIFNPSNARAFGEWLGRRYRNAGLIWILGGDRAVETETHRAILRAMAEGLAEGDGGTHLRTFHPRGSFSSADFVHDEPWLDFNMIQSGHCINSLDTHRYVTKDYARRPIKPTLDAEPCYEHHPLMKPEWAPLESGERYDAHAVRRAAYWSLFAGSCGHTYGAQPLWMMWDTHRDPMHNVALTWREGLALPGASQVRHARDLLLARPYFTRIPAPETIRSQPPDPMHFIAATRDGLPIGPTASYLLLYTPVRQSFKVDTSCLNGASLSLFWFNPRTGETTPWKSAPNTGSLSLALPDYPTHDPAPDWVLILEVY